MGPRSTDVPRDVRRSAMIAGAVVALAGFVACGAPATKAAEPPPATANAWTMGTMQATAPAPPPPAVAADASNPSEPPRPPPTAPVSPTDEAPPAPAPDPCAKYQEPAITCTGPLRHMDQSCVTGADRAGSMRAKVRHCYEQALQRDPALAPHGELVLTESVDEAGCVLSAKPLRADPSYPRELVACIAKAVGLFEKPPAGATVSRTVSVPLLENPGR